ncbi:hypothetical protein CHS0354_003836 [Potamilus streckersoni]|uniref:Uncharacterized protein n=1 Tax=Potamilus streckersoni TaxID=2493646 RepID=A0AAE0SGA1_9BIVA|nr:hypothetical protein CHS0354_003836 [Potamilus streckersoni]
MLLLYLNFLSRTKKKATDDIHYETQMNARPNKKVQPQANSSYGIVIDGTLDMDSTSTSLPRIQTVPQEPVLHMQPQGIKRISINNNDDHKSVDNKEPPLYSMVQKGQRKNDTTEGIEEGCINDEEYNKIEFEKRYVSESSGVMYDKATMHCIEPYKELDANVNNMNDVCCTTLDKNECSESVKENCSQIENLYDNATKMRLDLID